MRTGAQVTAWATTRALLVWAALSPWYGDGTGPIRPWSDVELYADYARAIVAGAVPYAELAIEYPAGSLPLVVLPGALATAPGVTYLVAFVVCTLLLDLAGLVALRRLGGRLGSPLGAWAWVVGVALLGPLALLRLDLLPVVAVLWAAERAVAGRWSWTGGLLVAGAAAKLWPAGLLPAAAVAAPRWRRVAVGTVAVAVPLLLVTAPVLAPMLETAVLRNVARGLQVESLWGSSLLVADALGLTATRVAFTAGADHVLGSGATALAWGARAVPVVVTVLGAWLAHRPSTRPPAERYLHAAEASTLVLVAAASVLSAQFLLWALGAVAATACSPRAAARRRAVAVGVACLLTAVEFPWLYEALKDASPLAVAVIALRNLLLVGAATDAIRDAVRADSFPSASATA